LDAYNNPTVVDYNVRLTTGPIVRKVLPLGQTETFEYDNSGRVTVHIDPLGHKTWSLYSVGFDANTETTIDSFGYTKINTLDCMGRTVQVADNGDPTQPSSEPTRVLSRTSYDCLSRTKEKTDILGL